jgi:D-sedoheptulose 7-phosphate isomerase
MASDARTPSAENTIRAHLAGSADLQRQTADACVADIWKAAQLIAATLAADGKLLLCGNGGSAADCQHMAAELVNRLTSDFERPGLAAIALTTDSSLLTAYANDINFEGVFARQIQALGRPGDVLLAISTSGSSRNVLKAVQQARTSGLTIVALTGSRGPLADLADAAIRVPGTNTAHIQETHLAIEHVICHLIEREVRKS